MRCCLLDVAGEEKRILDADPERGQVLVLLARGDDERLRRGGRRAWGPSSKSFLPRICRSNQLCFFVARLDLLGGEDAGRSIFVGSPLRAAWSCFVGKRMHAERRGLVGPRVLRHVVFLHQLCLPAAVELAELLRDGGLDPLDHDVADAQGEDHGDQEALDGAPQVGAQVLDVVPEAHPRVVEVVVGVVRETVAHRRSRNRRADCESRRVAGVPRVRLRWVYRIRRRAGTQAGKAPETQAKEA